MTDQELNKKLAEWAGFQRGWAKDVKTMDDAFDVEFFVDPKRNVILDLPFFIESLDACFKWLWKPTMEKLQLRNRWTYRQSEKELFRLWQDELKTDDYAKALCLAIEKLIDSS